MGGVAQHQRGLTIATVAAFVVGAGLMIPFEGTPGRIVGVLCLFAFIVLGVFTIARPERCAEHAGEQDAASG